MGAQREYHDRNVLPLDRLVRLKFDVGVIVDGVGGIDYHLQLLGGPCFSFGGEGLERFVSGFVTPISHVRRRKQRRFHCFPYRVLARLSKKQSQELSSFSAIIGKVTGSSFRICLQ